MVKTNPLRRQHDSPKKNRLIGIYKATKNIAAAARIENMPYSTARKIVLKYNKTGSTSNYPRSGRPAIVDDRLRRRIIREVTSNRWKPFSKIANQMNLPVGPDTVRKVMAQAGYHRRLARKVPYLSYIHRRCRRIWALSIQHWTRRHFCRIIFSDECYIYLGDKNYRIYVTRRPNEVYREDCLVPTFKQSSIRIMVWGCIMDGRKGPLVVLEYPGGKGGGMTAKRYQEQVLNGPLKAFHAEVSEKIGKIFFQQDNAPSHNSKSTLACLQQANITLFPHPPSSPDLNPIEPVWHELKAILRALPHTPTSVAELCAAVHAAWDSLSLEVINKHVGTMEQRVQAVLAACGGHTGY